MVSNTVIVVTNISNNFNLNKTSTVVMKSKKIYFNLAKVQAYNKLQNAINRKLQIISWNFNNVRLLLMQQV